MIDMERLAYDQKPHGAVERHGGTCTPLSCLEGRHIAVYVYAA